MILITIEGIDEPLHAEPSMHFGHRFPNGEVTEHDNVVSAQAGVSLFGGEVVVQMKYSLPWSALAAEHQPTWLVSTE